MAAPKANGVVGIPRNQHHRLKLVVVGDSYVGKTSLLFAYTEKQFVGDYRTTIFDNYSITVSLNDTKYTVNLFDTAGQEDYAHLRVLSYPQTDVFLLCFSMVDRRSLEACRTVWMPEIRKHCGAHTPVLLVGTKQDLTEAPNAHTTAAVERRAAQRVADELKCAAFLPCSSLTHRGLKRVFDEAILLGAAADGDARRASPMGIGDSIFRSKADVAKPSDYRSDVLSCCCIL